MLCQCEQLLTLAQSPDGAQIAVGMETGHVVIVDAETATVLTTYSAHAMGVRTVSWSPDSQVCGMSYSKRCVADPRAVALLGLGRRAHCVTRRPRRRQVWRARRRRRRDSAGTPGLGVDCCCFAGRAALGIGVSYKLHEDVADAPSGADSLVKLWDIGQRACVSTSTADAEVWAFAWQPEVEGGLPPGKQFAVAGDDKKVSLYRAAGAV